MADATTPTPDWVAKVLGREPRLEPIRGPIEQIRARGPVLVTGGLGSLGTAIGDLLDLFAIEHVLADVDEMDVTDPVAVHSTMELVKPGTVLHLAGAKHAPEGELDPLEPARVHIDGTRHVLEHAPEDAVVVTASTCKSCDPETAYGATKLIAERMTLNAGQRVARFHNVIETSGNVFEIWAGVKGPIDVAPCARYFISLAEAVSLVLFAASAPRGRYIIDPGARRSMLQVAAALYPHRTHRAIPARRGDRLIEPLMATCESAARVTPRILRVTNPHDPEA